MSSKSSKQAGDSSNKIESENVVIMGENWGRSDGEGKNYVGALFFILIGTLLLLNTTGIVPWDVWLSIWKLWPLFIVYAGLNLLFSGSRWGRFFTVLLAVLVMIFGFTTILMFFTFEQFFGEDVRFPNWMHRTSSVMWEYHGENVSDSFEISRLDYPDSEIESRTLDVDIDYGKLSIQDEPSDVYLSASYEYPQRYGKPNLTQTVESGTLKFTFASNARTSHMNLRNLQPTYDMVLGHTDLPTELDISVGAGEANIQLSSENLESIKLDVGAGRIIAQLSESPTEIDLSVGSGTINLIIPEGAGIRVEYNVGIGSLRILDKKLDGFGSDGKYTSDNYLSAEQKILIRANVGVGELTISTK